MKKHLMAFLGCTLTFCLLFSACGGDDDDIINTNEKPIGGDWRTFRGYTDDYDLMAEDDVTFSSLDDTYGYAAYETSAGTRIGALIPPKDGGYSFDDETDPPIISKDLDSDGICEIGICYKDGSVTWFGWDVNLASMSNPFESNPFVWIGSGDKDGVQPDGNEENDTSVNSPDDNFGNKPSNPSNSVDDGTAHLSDTIEIKAAFGNNQDFLTIDIYDTADDTYYGTIQFNDTAITANDLVCLPNSDPAIISRDLDGDGTHEVGVPFLDGLVYWFSLENGQFLEQGVGTEAGPDPSVENVMLDSLFELLGDRLDGKTVVRSGTVEIDGMACEEYAIGTDHDENLVVEDYYAISYDGTLYYYNAADGGEYILCQP